MVHDFEEFGSERWGCAMVMRMCNGDENVQGFELLCATVEREERGGTIYMHIYWGQVIRDLEGPGLHRYFTILSCISCNLSPTESQL